MSWKELDDLDEKVAKLFGGECTTPNPKVDVGDLFDKRMKAFETFSKSRDDLADLLEKYEDADDAVKNGVKRAAAVYQTADFGKDKKNKDDAKKIEQARKMYAAFFNANLKEIADGEKGVDELQKHLVQLGNYKGPGK
jgi:hypothetical protein